MSRKQRRQIALVAILAVLLALLVGAYLQYRSTGGLGLGLGMSDKDALVAPEYLYSFSGEGADRLAQPLGVLVDGGKVYVTDSKRGVVDVFTSRGDHVATWGKGQLGVPLYIAKNPKTGDFYISDRRLRAVLIFGPDGKFKRVFDPKLPKSERPKFETKVQWAPVALAFAPDGSLYVTEILNGHRFVIFGPDGKFLRAVGSAGLVVDAKTGEGAFQFPNSIKVHGDEVWIADSNNRRLQVYLRNGDFKRIVVTLGLPRGFDFLPRSSDSDPERLVLIDTLSHDAVIVNATAGEKELTFGSHGVMEAQFNYPNDTSVDPKSRMFIADTANGRIQVWGWPAKAGAVPTPSTPTAWALCLSPVLLLPLLLLLRKRRHTASEEFMLAIYDAGAVRLLTQKRVRWEVLPDAYDRLKGLSQDGISLETLLSPTEFSDSDARHLQDKYDLDPLDADLLALALRGRLLGVEGRELKRVAKVLGLEVVDHSEFIEMRGGTERPGIDGADGQ